MDILEERHFFSKGKLNCRRKLRNVEDMMDLENWIWSEQSPTNLGLSFGGVNCLVVFLTHFTCTLFLLRRFHNMRTLNFKDQRTFLAAVIKCVGDSSQLPTTAERVVIKSNRWLRFRQHSRKLEAVAEHLMTVAKNVFVGWALNFRVRMLLKGAVMANFTALFDYSLITIGMVCGKAILWRTWRAI